MCEKIFDLADRAMTVALIFLLVGLVFFACMQVCQSGLVTAGFNKAIAEMVFPSIPNHPMGI